MLALKTNVKGLILTIILFLGLMNIKFIYIHDNIKQVQNNKDEKKVASTNKTFNSANLEKLQKSPTSSSTTNTDKVDSNKDLNKKSLSRGGSNINNEVEITLTFYTSLAEENGGFSGINCSGKKLTPGTVANNVLPLGTKIYTKEFGTLTVADRGGNNFDTIHRLDVYIPREEGESDKDYLTRVNDMGKVKVKGYITK